MATQALHGRLVAGHRLIRPIAPVFGIVEAAELVRRYRPALVVCQAAGRAALSLGASYQRDDAIAKQRRRQPVDTRVVPAAQRPFTSLPIRPCLFR
jgi:pyrrolidone-carboxylate peptidase